MTYEEVKQHVDHDFIVEKLTDGDITLFCLDCNAEIKRWSLPTENTWHGTEWANATGGEPDIHD